MAEVLATKLLTHAYAAQHSSSPWPERSNEFPGPSCCVGTPAAASELRVVLRHAKPLIEVNLGSLSDAQVRGKIEACTIAFIESCQPIDFTQIQAAPGLVY